MQSAPGQPIGQCTANLPDRGARRDDGLSYVEPQSAVVTPVERLTIAFADDGSGGSIGVGLLSSARVGHGVAPNGFAAADGDFSHFEGGIPPGFLPSITRR